MTTSVGSGRTGSCGSLHVSMVGLDQTPRQPLGTGGSRLDEGHGDVNTPRPPYPEIRLSAASPQVFHAHADRIGAVVAGDGRTTWLAARTVTGRSPALPCST